MEVRDMGMGERRVRVEYERDRQVPIGQFADRDAVAMPIGVDLPPGGVDGVAGEVQLGDDGAVLNPAYEHSCGRGVGDDALPFREDRGGGDSHE